MKQHLEKIYVGIDVCKSKLDVSSPALTKHYVFPNTAAGIRDLFKIVNTLEGSVHLVLEPTGGYEKKILHAAFDHGTDISRVNAERARDFAKASGALAKTDKADAASLAAFGQAMNPIPNVEPSEKQMKLSAISRRRDSLMKKLIVEKNLLEKADDSYVRMDINSLIKILKARVAKCESELDQLIDEDAELAIRRQRMQSVKGVGPVASGVLIAELPELGQATDAGISALAGVAPFNKDSGSKSGKRMIRGGRSRVRRALYMPMMSAVQHNPILKEFYQRLIARGKPHHVAIIAAMRKLLRLLNKMMADPKFMPS